MARSPFRALLKVTAPRDLATRSLGVIAGVFDYARLMKEGKVPGPLLLTIRAANDLARRILEQPSPTPTPAQRRTLLAAGAQLRAMTSRIIISAEGRDPHSVEAELAELITRTLALIDRVTAEPPAIDAEGWSAPKFPPRDS